MIYTVVVYILIIYNGEYNNGIVKIKLLEYGTGSRFTGKYILQPSEAEIHSHPTKLLQSILTSNLPHILLGHH